ncbi:Lar family restriction alleviation protein [Christensenella minuta]|uniref:Lar family restriction alleviation protein n=1 Tax=Christensenella minuta TaxID=626937 RepID=UPI00215787E0|nr:Lar family restriction alleviation protein [Christensenella minuta]
MNETAKLKSCPFCRGDNIKMMHKDVGFIGWNGLGAKKIKYQSYAMCNKCYSKGSPATYEYEVDTERGRMALKENDKKAAAAWNRRATENPQPLTLDELREMEGEPVYNADNKTWYVVEDIDEIDELSTVISMTDTTEFDSEEGLPKFYRTKPEGCGE